MLHLRSWCNVADNSGAKKISVIQTVGSTKGKFARVGDVVIASVKVASPGGQVKKKEVVKAVVARTVFPTKRADGTVIKFDDNAVIIINPDGMPRGTRILGPVARELRDRGYQKIISLATEVL